MKFIPYGKQSLDDSDIQAVINVLQSDWLTQGPCIEKFEKTVARKLGAKYAVAVSSGTAALHIACLALGLKQGDEGITSTITFLASSNALIYCGGKPVFVDIDSNSLNIDTAKIEEKITKHTKVLIPVHFAGEPCDMEKIYEFARKYNLHIIEDAAHAIGSKYKDSFIGSCKYSDMTIFSFHPVKHITTGEGGMILTNSKVYYEKLLELRTHGITRDSKKFKNGNFDNWYYEMQSLGFNYRLTDMQAALGLSQLEKLDKFIDRRREIVSKYNKSFKDIKHIKIPEKTKDGYSSYHLYVLRIDFAKLKITKAEIVEKLKNRNIGTQVHYIPVHTQPYYQEKFGYKLGDYPVAEKYYQEALSFPLYPKMDDEEVDYVIQEVKNIFEVSIY
ncbi:MAG: UDP-4-amino-4,6-dideoxy-N-acetyl-beta-L-altrosamine transaminase [bacterium]|nr:UDP-4-amino-4,6-dideoxy-N-acetyl-beta-L-altrosamine transaminase [bacterium]